MIWTGQLDEQTTSKIAERFAREGLLGADYGQHDLRQAINDMNQQLRYAVGAYDTPPRQSRCHRAWSSPGPEL